jgi:hypothetical protein
VKTGWNSMRIMCQSGYSRNVVSASLNFKYPTKRVDLVLSGYHHLIDIAGHRPTEIFACCSNQSSLFLLNVACLPEKQKMLI